MSAVWVKLTALLCLSSTVQSGPAAKSEVLWKDAGESITIQCRCKKNPDVMYVKRSLKKDVDVLYKHKEGNKDTITKDFQGRLQVAGDFPNLDILIKNLSSDDTGPFWCMYKNFDMKNDDPANTDGTGSVLLVVKGQTSSETCNPPTEKLVLVSIVISAAVLLCIILGVLVWCIKKTMDKAATKPRRIPNNDVYEDMRGTLRR